MTELKYYKRNGYEFQIVERIGNVARAVGRKGKQEQHQVVTILEGERISIIDHCHTFDNEGQAVGKLREMTQ